MRFFGLFMLIFIMWMMIIIVSYFLIFIIGPLHINIFYNSIDRLISSIIKASLAIGLVVGLILLLSFLKTKYLKRTLLKNWAEHKVNNKRTYTFETLIKSLNFTSIPYLFSSCFMWLYILNNSTAFLNRLNLPFIFAWIKLNTSA